MLRDALLAFAHYLSIFATAFFLLLEWVRCREPVTLNRARLLAKMDGFYGAAALAALATGFARVFYGAKGSSFYFANPVFNVKLGVYIVVALLSIPVTVAFFRWRKALSREHGEVTVPARAIRRVRALLLAEILLLALLPLLAVLMARGIGAP
jgi:putative membrane protein